MADMKVAVIDGMGGSIGHQIILELRRNLPEATEIIALGANAIATNNMMKARANRGATGENAVRICIGEADVIMGSLSILVPNSMMGELTPEMASSIASSRGRKILLPLTNPRIEIMGTSEIPLPKLIEQAVELVKEMSEQEGGGDV
jgi:malic enzyme